MGLSKDHQPVEGRHTIVGPLMHNFVSLSRSDQTADPGPSADRRKRSNCCPSVTSSFGTYVTLYQRLLNSDCISNLSSPNKM